MIKNKRGEKERDVDELTRYRMCKGPGFYRPRVIEGCILQSESGNEFGERPTKKYTDLHS
jgi:hypothetical protein